MTDEVKTRGVLDFFFMAKALRESESVDERISPSKEAPIRRELYPLIRPYFISLDLQRFNGYCPRDDGPGVA